jgi:hypothetical protein
MMRDLTRIADRSAWISGDRVNACIGADANGIIEFGFHGLQPVSRNSRILVRPEGVARFGVRTSDGRETPWAFRTVEWEPHRICSNVELHGTQVACEFVATDRTVHCSCRGLPPGTELIVRVALDACFIDVRGERTWAPPIVRGSRLTLCCRDTIDLLPWMKRTGPYAGDFLIPEHVRRKIFSREIRSGMATPEDLRPEYRDAHQLIYDAPTWIVMGGNAGTWTIDGEHAVFVRAGDSVVPGEPAFTIGGSESDVVGREAGVLSHTRVERVRNEAAAVSAAAPQMSCDVLPELSSMMATIPALVRSCTVTDIGMTRATPGSYYWLWAWDNLVTGQECLRWGANDIAGSIVRYVHSHRDTGGRIPARWTRAHEPMDTPPHGALDFLLVHLAYEHALAIGDKAGVLPVYPEAVDHLRSMMAADPDGLIPSLSFYPDRPSAFGRSDCSVVTLEVGCTYVFARLMENVAVWLGDRAVQQEACRFAQRIEAVFVARFWDARTGFFIDSYDRVTGARNETWPLFSLLFLQSALGMQLFRGLVPAAGRFLEERLQTPMGTRLIPADDHRTSGEDALGSWYPHWDIYMLKLLRRAGRSGAIEHWARSAERVLQRLGYVPEFIALDGLTADAGPAWLRHGACANLNCVTGWHRSVVEGLFGIETDPGGMSVVPLGLDVGPMALRGYRFRGTRWDCVVRHGGPHLQEMRIDGELVHGCLKVPVAYQDGGSHELAIVYGPDPTPTPVREVMNAEVISCERHGRSVALQLRTLGIADLILDLPTGVQCLIDGVTVPLAKDESAGCPSVRIGEAGVHECIITQRP